MELKKVKDGCDRMREDFMLFIVSPVSHADMQVRVKKSRREHSSQRTYVITDNPSAPESEPQESPPLFMQPVISLWHTADGLHAFSIGSLAYRERPVGQKRCHRKAK